MPLSTLVFVDNAIANYKFLASGIDKSAAVIIIDSKQDGVSQISAALAAEESIESVHIFSHGAPGTLQLGTSLLSLDTIDAYDLQPWQQALQQANLLIYGCRVAAGETGDRFLTKLHQRTKANIAATATPTGSAAQGGDWNLERSIGAIEPFSVLHSDVMAQYDGTLEFVIPNLLYALATTNENNAALPSELRVVDLESGNSRVITGTTDGRGNVVPPLLFQAFALARQAATGRLYYIETNASTAARGAAATARVAYFDVQTQQSVLVGTTGIPTSEGEFVKLAQAQDGRIFGITGNSSNLYRLEVAGATAGAATNLGAIQFNGAPLPVGGGDIAFDPNNPNRLFVTVAQPGNPLVNVYQLYTVDVSNPGLPATLVGDIRSPNGTVLNDVGSGSLAFGQDGFLYLTSDLDSNPVTDDSRLFQVDPATGIVVDADRVRPVARLNDFATLPTPTAQVNLILTKSDGLQSVRPGDQITYTIAVTNTSATGDLADIRLTDFLTGVSGVTWTGEFTGGVPGNLSGFLPGSQSGTGDIDVQFNLGAQATLTYTVRGTVNPNAAIGSTLTNTANVIVPPGIIDPNPGNNTTTDITTIGTVTLPDIPDDEDESNCVPGINRRGRQNRNNRLLGDNNINRLTGANRNDVLRGFGCPDLLRGGGGRDLLRGGSSGDQLQGNQGNDRLNGGSGRDRLNGGLGNDTMLGGTGRDSLRGGSGRDRLFGEAGADRLVGNAGDDFLRGGSENDVLVGRLNRDRLIGNRGNDILRGNLGRDRLGGGPGSDRLDGGRGDDVILGGNGDDSLLGRLGFDLLVGGNGNDSLDGQANADRLDGGAGRDRLLGKGGADRLVGGAQADLLNGGQGFDRILGNGGSDRIIGGQRADQLTGGGGRDRFEYRNIGEGGDQIFDFSTVADRIVLSRIFAGSSYGGNRPFRQYVRLEQSGADTTVLLDVNGDRRGGFESFITLSGVSARSLSARNFVV